MQVRLGQVVYTLTQFPTVKQVSFRLDGTPVNVFSSEGIVLSHPVGRGDYKDLLPVIVVSHPTPGSASRAPSPSGERERLRGERDRQGARRERARGRQHVHDGNLRDGLPGDVLGRRRLPDDREQQGTIVVSDDDAAGTGRPPHEVRIPVVLAPG